MRVEVALLSKLDPLLQPLTDMRIYALSLPQEAPWPGPTVTYSRVSTVDVRDLDGVAYKRARIQYSCWDTSWGKVITLAAKIRELEGFCGTLPGGIEVVDIVVANETDLYVPDVKLYHVPIDLIVTFKGGE